MINNGKETLAELFEHRSQLIVYHFMFPPEDDEGCPHCSFWADSFNGSSVHLPHRDVSFVAISRAPLSKVELFKQRMGWGFKWVSSFQSDFNFAYQAPFTPEEVKRGAAFFNYTRTDPGMMDREGISVFYKDENGAIFHTYSCYARGIDMMNATYQYLDLVPKGRDEQGLEDPQAWVRHHDRYQDSAHGHRFGSCRTRGARLRHTEREHDEFATRTYPYPGAAADPGRRVMGDSGLAVQDSKRDGHGSDHGHGSRVVPGHLGRDDDRDDVSHGGPNDPGLRAGPARPGKLREGLWAHMGLRWRVPADLDTLRGAFVSRRERRLGTGPTGPLAPFAWVWSMASIAWDVTGCSSCFFSPWA
jgi:predicted dithiol-disulfide oxidoreductase (DUF899 family)